MSSETHKLSLAEMDPPQDIFSVGRTQTVETLFLLLILGGVLSMCHCRDVCVCVRARACVCVDIHLHCS